MNEIKVGNFVIEKITSTPTHVELILKDDESNKFEAIIKDNAKAFLRIYKVEDSVLCKYRSINKTSLEIIQIKRLTTKENNFNLENYKKKFDQLKNKVKDKDYKIILNGIFTDEIKELFFVYPCSTNKKRNFRHSLLQHTIEVTEIAIDLSKHFDKVNINLLITGSLLHDIGKIQSFDYDNIKNRVQETEWENLLGHVPISALYVSKIMPQDIEPEKAMNLYHIILSFKNNGYISCKTKEAFILRKANELNNEYYLGDF